VSFKQRQSEARLRRWSIFRIALCVHCTLYCAIYTYVLVWNPMLDILIR